MKRISSPTTQRVLTLALAIAGISLPLASQAQTYYVGTCKPGKADFKSIQEAVTDAASGATINICPGTYSEAIIITQPLTLQGMTSGDSAGVTVTAPSESLVPFETSFGAVSAQIAVINPGGPVNISGIVVDGTGVSPDDATLTAASILYDSASGTLNHVAAQNLQASNVSMSVTSMAGIFVLDDDSVSPTVTVKNSVVSIPNSSLAEFGIEIPFGSDNVGLDVTNSSISIVGEGAAIADRGKGAGTVNSNSIFSSGIGAVGIDLAGSSLDITGNTISAPFGVYDSGSGGTSTAISGNTLTNSMVAITSLDPTATIKSNQIFSTPGATSGIDLQCAVPTALGANTFVGSPIGLNNVPSGASLQSSAGNFYGVPIIEQVCGN
jgi:hypothetical protein